jgi:NADH:ubiquinone oxidoreductase subunit E
MNKGVSTTATRRWQRRIAKKFAAEQRYLIPALQYVQSQEGYLPPDAMAAVAAHLGVSESRVFGVASFYSLFHFEPRGRNTVTVCRGTACHVRGSGGLLRDLENLLGIEAGSTTQDMLFSLETVACFGSCALAPVVVINDKVYGRQTTASLKLLIENTRQEQGDGAAAGKKGGGKRGKRSRKRSQRARQSQ